jgi:hypothetical protein
LAINDDTRTVDLTFSTGADVIRYDWDTGSATSSACRWTRRRFGSTA